VEIKITPKTEQGIRKRSLKKIFGSSKKTQQGNHNSIQTGGGDEINPNTLSLVIRLGIDFTNLSQCPDQAWHR